MDLRWPGLASLCVLFACTPPRSGAVSTAGLAQLYADLQRDAANFGYEDGQWTEDFGDAAAFGPTYYVHAGLQEDRQDYLDRAQEAAHYDLGVLAQGTDDMGWLAANLEEAFMAVQGAITWAGVTGQTEHVDVIDALIDTIDPIVQATGDYMELNLGDFASDLYGPTSVTGGVAVIYLQHAHYLDAHRSPEWIDRAAQITEAIDAAAFEGDHYRFGSDVDKLYLYPNAVMILVLSRLYELTGQADYLAQAQAVFGGIAPLWDDRMELYHSPYSTESQGAQTDEYSTLSSQNYLMLGLMELYRHTEESTYLDKVVAILQSIRIRMYNAEEGLLVHHWVDGRPANHTDPDFFCSGCNLQTLFILWYLQHELDVALH